MNSINYRSFFLALSFALLIINASAPVQAASYALTDIGVTRPFGGFYSYGNGINASGQVTGKANVAATGGPHAYFFDGTTRRDIYGAEHFAVGNGINDLGQIAGVASTNFRSYAAFFDGTNVFDVGGSFLYARGTVAYGINNSGQITGQIDIRDPVNGQFVRSFFYDQNGTRDIGTLGGEQTAAYGINNLGWVTGWSQIAPTPTSFSRSHVFLYDGTTMHDLGRLAGSDSSTGKAINDLGHVTGSAYVEGLPSQSGNPTYQKRAVFYDGNAIHDIGSLNSSSYGDSEALGINIHDQIVGTSSLEFPLGPHAFIYDSVNGMVDLNTLIPSDPESEPEWILRSATDINDNGQITGYGEFEGQLHAFVLTPIPEPGTIMFGAIGMILVFAAAKRRT